MGKTFMMSALRKQAHGLDADAFERIHPYDWIIWEPGPWMPPMKASDSTVEATGPASKKKGGESLAMALMPTAKAQLTLGRADSNDLVINDATLSRVHLVFERAGEARWAVRDAESASGSYIEERPIPTDRPLELNDESRLRAGQVHLTYHSRQSLYMRLKLGW